MPIKTKRARIFLVDDHPITRLGLAQLINQQDDLVVCGEASSRAEALQGITQAQPDLAIIDLMLGPSSGLDLIKDLSRNHPDLHLLVLTGFRDPALQNKALQSGAHGFLEKVEGADNILKAIRCLRDGQEYNALALNTNLAGDFRNGTHLNESCPTAPDPCDITDVSAAKEYIRVNFHDQINSQSVANHVHISERHLRRLFKQATGLKISQYRTQVRIEHAKQLLGTGQRINEIAYACGFQSIQHFNLAFKQALGKSPSDYRASVKLGQ